jgi:hypothetical protein
LEQNQLQLAFLVLQALIQQLILQLQLAIVFYVLQVHIRQLLEQIPAVCACHAQLEHIQQFQVQHLCQLVFLAQLELTMQFQHPITAMFVFPVQKGHIHPLLDHLAVKIAQLVVTLLILVQTLSLRAWSALLDHTHCLVVNQDQVVFFAMLEHIQVCQVQPIQVHVNNVLLVIIHMQVVQFVVLVQLEPTQQQSVLHRKQLV